MKLHQHESNFQQDSHLSVQGLGFGHDHGQYFVRMKIEHFYDAILFQQAYVKPAQMSSGKTTTAAAVQGVGTPAVQ